MVSQDSRDTCCKIQVALDNIVSMVTVTAPDEVHDVATTQGQEEGRTHAAGYEVEESGLGRLEDVHHSDGEQKTHDVGKEGGEEVGPRAIGVVTGRRGDR